MARAELICIDDTLVDPKNEKILESAEKILKEAQKIGYRLRIATGRAYR
ncbi:MAG: HAD hydrolase family protein [Clostridiales bacterium]|nr:HAD hydrolase family protein [Clostridiales bacterium]